MEHRSKTLGEWLIAGHDLNLHLLIVRHWLSLELSLFLKFLSLLLYFAIKLFLMCEMSLIALQGEFNGERF